MKFSVLSFAVAALVVVCATGCRNFDYVGQKFEPLPESVPVAFFEKRGDVPAGKYAIIGRGVLYTKIGMDAYDLQEYLFDEARKVGAEAILVVSSEERKIGLYTTEQESFMTPATSPTNTRHQFDDAVTKEVSLTENYTRREYLYRVLFLRDRAALEKDLKAREATSVLERRKVDLPPAPVAPKLEDEPAKVEKKSELDGKLKKVPPGDTPQPTKSVAAPVSATAPPIPPR